MALNRRQLLAGLATGAATALAQDRVANAPKIRLAPMVCTHIEQFPKIGYNELGGFLQMMGFDGCVLSVEPGGHITPEHADLDLMRAVEAMTGSHVDVPALTAPLTAFSDPSVRMIFGVGGQMGIPLFRPGHWKFPAAANVEARLAEIQRDISVLSSYSNQTHMALALHNDAGDSFGATLWDTQAILRGIDPRLAGYDLDIAYATAHGGVEAATLALRMALPRIKMVSVRDCYWNKTPAGWKLTECPLGEGMVEWTGFFGALAKGRFTGPVVLYVAYKPEEELAAIRKDLAFLKKQLTAAYG